MQLQVVACSVLVWFSLAACVASEPAVSPPAQLIPMFKPVRDAATHALDPKNWNPDAEVSGEALSAVSQVSAGRPSTTGGSLGMLTVSVTATGKCVSVSVVNVGVFCIEGPVCSGNSASGACPEARPGLEQGSHCALVHDDVYGCRPGPRPAR